MNVQIPIHLGKVIDVLTSLSAREGISALAELKDPALKLFSVYVLQVGLTRVL